LWLGDGFDEAYYVALLLIIPASLPLIQNLGISIMQAMNKYKFKAISTSIMSIFNIIISVYLASRYGATGAAIGTAVALILCNVIIINIYYAKNIKLKIGKFWGQIIKNTAFFAIPATIMYLFVNNVAIDGWFKLAAFAGVYTLIFCAYSYLICFNEYERKIIKTIIGKIKRSK